MDLILWRHAQAVDVSAYVDDLRRPLTTVGEQQAKQMAVWLKKHLPANTRVCTSPALRTRQTVQRLTADAYEVVEALAPHRSADDLLQACGWPYAKTPVLVVGHQPTLGAVVQRLLGMDVECAVKKGAVWWLQQRVREGREQVILRTVQVPKLL